MSVAKKKHLHQNKNTYKLSDTPLDSREFIDIHTTKSNLPGLAGLVESIFRKFKNIAFYLLLFPIGILYVLSVSLALMPGLLILRQLWLFSQTWESTYQLLLLGPGITLLWLCYGFSIILIVPIFNAPMIPFVKSCRGNWYSLHVIPWYYHNALTQLVRYTFLDIITPTPLNILFFRLMGMKIGKNCIINTSKISDPCMITLGNHVTIGGSATIFAHYAMKGILIVKKVEIHDGTTVGLKASIMGNVIIGKNNVISPHQVVMPKTRIPDKERL